MNRQNSACIVELRGRYAAALTEDGQFVRVRNRGYEIGDRVQIGRQEAAVTSRAKITAFASMAAGFLLLTLGGFAGYRAPVGVVSIDVNPSIEYTINCLDRVLEIEAVNQDAEPILNGIDEEALLYQPVDSAVEQTIVALHAGGYLPDGAENDVVLSASSYSAAHAERLAARLEDQSAKQPGLNVLSVPVSHRDVEAAHALGTTAGRLYLVEQLQQAAGSEDPFDTERWLTIPVREILQLTLEVQEGNVEDGAQSGWNAPYGTPSPAETPSAQAGLPGWQPSQSGELQPQGTPSPRPSGQQHPGGGSPQGGGGQP